MSYRETHTVLVQVVGQCPNCHSTRIAYHSDALLRRLHQVWGQCFSCGHTWFSEQGRGN